MERKNVEQNPCDSFPLLQKSDKKNSRILNLSFPFSSTCICACDTFPILDLVGAL